MNRDLNAVFHFWEDFICQNDLSRKPPCNCSAQRGNNTDGIRKDYPTTGVLKLIASVCVFFHRITSHQEGLPDYWGIETLVEQHQ